MADIELPKSNRNPSRFRRVVGVSRLLAVFAFRGVMKLLLVLVFIVVGLLVGGFLQFTSKVSKIVPPTNIEVSDSIVVLTGGSIRIATALDLLSHNKGKRLLISGVNPDTIMADIVAMHPDKAELFDCCVELERIAKDTIGNAVETQKWVRKHEYESLIVVTSAYHMPRSLLEYRRQMPAMRITPYPVSLESINLHQWWKHSSTLRIMVNEYLKYLGAQSRDYIHKPAFDTVRGSLWGNKDN